MLPNHFNYLAEEIKNIFLRADLNSLQNYKVVAMGANPFGVTLEIDFKENISEVHEPIEINIKVKKIK